MGGNPFYSNAEAYAFEILQQKLIKEAQRSAQQTVMEFSALKTLFNQGQFVYCIPIGGFGLSNYAGPFPFCPAPPVVCPPNIPFGSPEPQNIPLATPTGPSPPLQPPAPPSLPPVSSHPPLTSLSPLPPLSSRLPLSTQPTHNPPQAVNVSPSQPHPLLNNQSIVHVNVRNGQNKVANLKPGSEECTMGDVGIDVTIDLREYIPAEISLDVEEKMIEVKAYHVDSRGSKTFSRRYDLPACILLDSVKCVLSHDGYLVISAAWVKME